MTSFNLLEVQKGSANLNLSVCNTLQYFHHNFDLHSSRIFTPKLKIVKCIKCMIVSFNHFVVLLTITPHSRRYRSSLRITNVSTVAIGNVTYVSSVLVYENFMNIGINIHFDILNDYKWLGFMSTCSYILALPYWRLNFCDLLLQVCWPYFCQIWWTNSWRYCKHLGKLIWKM